MRVLIDRDPGLVEHLPYAFEHSLWKAQWVGLPETHRGEPVVTAYRRRFKLEKPLETRIHVSADERYELFLDGERIGRGSERGHRDNWFYETYELCLAAGEHVLAARTWWLGALAPYAQISVRPAFFLMGEGEADKLLSTGVAPWECKKLGGYSFDPQSVAGAFLAAGARTSIRGREFAWGFEKGEGDLWLPVRVIGRAAVAAAVFESDPYWLLRPAILPQMMEEDVHVGKVRHVSSPASGQTQGIAVRQAENLGEEVSVWDALLKWSAPVRVAANSVRRVIIDLQDYYCAYPQLTLSGGRGATVRISWAESLFEQPHGKTKGQRDQIEGKFFVGRADVFEADGGNKRLYEPLWWCAGRYVELTVTTGAEPLVIDSLVMLQTHYPHQFESHFESSDARLAQVIKPALRTLEMCSHETYMDCPYYEQLMYVGDTRLEVLTTYVTTRDDHLPRKAMLMFDLSRNASGLTSARTPTRTLQTIPPFSLWWVMMVHDYAMWRDDRAFVAERMRGVRAVLDFYRSRITKEGLVQSPAGWNFVDWVPGWKSGMPADANDGINGTLNWQTALAMHLAGDLEELIGEELLAKRNRQAAARIGEAADAAFWDEGRGLYADDRAKQHFSEHSQCLAILGGQYPAKRRDRMVESLLKDPKLDRTTIYFTHYLFEAYRQTGHIANLFERMGLWFELEKLGMKTTLESPEPSRSDCHAWAAHPVYHLLASVLGIRPGAAGFGKVRIEPQLGPLTWARGSMPHALGHIDVDLKVENGRVTGEVKLPEGLSGTMAVNGVEKELKAGVQKV